MARRTKTYGWCGPATTEVVFRYPLPQAEIDAIIAADVESNRQGDESFAAWAAENPNEWVTAQLAWRRTEKCAELRRLHRNWIRGQLAMHPADRLAEALAYWRGCEEGDRDEYQMPEYDLIPWIERAERCLKAGNLDGACIVLRDAYASMGGVFPDGLNVVEGEGWEDVIVAGRDA
jgi:hypothetical protein